MKPTVGYGPFWSELGRRTLYPFRQPTFVISLLLMLVFSGWAIWIEVAAIHYQRPHHDSASLHTAVVTFFPALVGTTFVQLVMDETRKPLRALSVLVLVLSLIMAPLLALDEGSFAHYHWFAVVVSTAVAIWLWVVANAANATFQDDPDAAAGGNPLSDLPGGTGDYEV